MNLTIQRHLAAALVCGAALLTAAAHGATKKVLLLNGNAGAAITTGQKLIPTDGSSFTVALWLKADASKSKARGDDVIFRQQTGRGEVSMMYDAANHKYGAQRYSSYSGAAATEKVWTSAPEGIGWHYIALVYDKTGKTLSLFVDGVATTTENCSNEIKPTSSNFTMANYIQNQGDRFLGGAMAEMSVWNSALSAEKLAELRWARPSGEKLTGCVAYWPFDENNSGASARDLSATGATATLPTKQSGGVPIYNLSAVDDFPAGFNEGDTRIYLSVERIYRPDIVEVTVSDSSQNEKGDFLKDSTATFSVPTTANGATFVRWYGDVPEEQAYNPTITLTIDAAKRISPFFTGIDWLYDADDKAIFDGNWKIRVATDADTGAMKMTSVDASSLVVPLLDFRKPVRDADNTPYAIVSATGAAFEYNAVLEELRLPDTLVESESELNVHWYHGTFRGCTKLKTVEPLLPASMTVVGEAMFNDCSALKGSVVLGGGTDECVVRETFVEGSGKTARYAHQFCNSGIQDVRVCPNVKRLPYCVFSGCSALTNVVIEKDGVTEIATNAFANCKAVASFTLSQRPVIAETAFNGWTSNQCRFVVSAVDPGWSAYMADPANFTPWKDLDEATRAGYAAKFPGAGRPLGLSLTLPKNQWLCNDGSLGMMLLVK